MYEARVLERPCQKRPSLVVPSDEACGKFSPWPEPQTPSNHHQSGPVASLTVGNCQLLVAICKPLPTCSSR